MRRIFLFGLLLQAIVGLTENRSSYGQQLAIPQGNYLPQTTLPVAIQPAAPEMEERIRVLEETIRRQRIQHSELEQRLLMPPVTETSTNYVAPEGGEMGAKTPTSDLEKRIAAIEKERKKEAEAAKKKKEEEAEKKALEALKKEEDAKKPTMRIVGRIHADYWTFPHTSPGANLFETGNAADSVDDRFLFRRVRLGFGGQVADNMEYRMELDFNNPNSPQLKDVWIGWNELPLVQNIRLGNQKRPYGLDHLNSSNHNIFLERPAVVEAFNQDARRFGLASYNFSEDLAWNWRYGAYLMQDLQNIGSHHATTVDEDYQVEFAGRLANTAWFDESSGGRGYFHWDVAGTIASPDGTAPASATAPSAVSAARFQTRPEARSERRWLDTGVIPTATTYELAALEGVANWGPVQIVSELQHVWVQCEARPDCHFHGAYVYLSYFLTGEHMPWERTTGTLGRVKPFENFFLVRTEDGVNGGWGAWQVALRYSYLDLTDAGINGGIENEVSAGLVWYWNQHARMLFNVGYGDIQQRGAGPIRDGQYTIIGTRFHIDF